jgi:hypothetical protein
VAEALSDRVVENHALDAGEKDGAVNGIPDAARFRKVGHEHNLLKVENI